MSDDLISVGQQLRDLASETQRPAVEAILARSRDRRLRVLVAGEAKRGKSTLLNRLLDCDLLPTGVLPVTAINTTVRYGDDESLVVRYLNGQQARHAVGELAEFVTERANPNNVLGVSDVEVTLVDGPLVRHRVELVDTPGTGSVYEHNTRVAKQAYESLDAVIMVLTATPPMNSSERALLEEVSRNAVRTFVVLNKTDQLLPSEIVETIEFTATICAEAGVPSGHLFAVSARDGDDGYLEFRTHFEAYLTDRAEDDAERALRGHSLRLAQQMLDEAALELRALELARGETAKRIATFSVRLNRLATQAIELSDRCRATERRLIRSLDDDARNLGATLAQRCLEQTQTGLADLHDESPAEVEHRGRELVEQILSSAVLDWRETHARELERQLAELLETLESDRVQQLEALRDAAASELGLTMWSVVEPVPLHPGRSFWLEFSAAPAVELPGSQFLRQHGLRAADRARQRVLSEIPELADRQVGRARADLQQRLGESVREVMAALRLRHSDTLTRLQDSLSRAMAVQQADTTTFERELQRAQIRFDQLQSVRSRL